MTTAFAEDPVLQRHHHEDPLLENALRVSLHQAHQQALDNGWHHDVHTGEPLSPSPGQTFSLLHSELSEALEAERKSLQDRHLPHRPGAEVEMADFLGRLLDYAGRHNLPLVERVLALLGFEATSSVDPNPELGLTPNDALLMEQGLRHAQGVCYLTERALHFDRELGHPIPATPEDLLANLHRHTSRAFELALAGGPTATTDTLARMTLDALEYGTQFDYDIPGAAVEKRE